MRPGWLNSRTAAANRTNGIVRLPEHSSPWPVEHEHRHVLANALTVHAGTGMNLSGNSYQAQPSLEVTRVIVFRFARHPDTTATLEGGPHRRLANSVPETQH